MGMRIDSSVRDRTHCQLWEDDWLAWKGDSKATTEQAAGIQPQPPWAEHHAQRAVGTHKRMAVKRGLQSHRVPSPASGLTPSPENPHKGPDPASRLTVGLQLHLSEPALAWHLGYRRTSQTPK